MSQMYCVNEILAGLNHHRRSKFGCGAWIVSAAVLMTVLASLPALSQGADPVTTSRQLTVTWPNAQEGRTNLQNILRQQQTRPGFQNKRVDPANLATVKVPVLVPAKIFDFDSLLVKADQTGNGYYANAKVPGLRVLVIGSRIVHEVPGQSPASTTLTAPRPTQYTITKTESGYTLGLARFGIPYTISVECERQQDVRCAGDQYIRSLAEGMVYIGGEP